MLGAIERGMVEHLESLGHAVIAPANLPQNVAEPRPRAGWSSCWSMRHVGFVAGLGTLCLSGGLITRRGVAHRMGSVVTSVVIAPTRRPYGEDPFAWCLRTSRGTCGKCIERCPVGAIGRTVAQRDKIACQEHGRRTRREGKALYGWEGSYGCGLCQTGVPCESRRPSTGPEA